MRFTCRNIIHRSYIAASTTVSCVGYLQLLTRVVFFRMATELANKKAEREALRGVIQQWNANRLDLFELSEPNEVSTAAVTADCPFTIFEYKLYKNVCFARYLDTQILAF